MKLPLILALLTLSVSTSWAQRPQYSSELLVCLGLEEKAFHTKKQTGSTYDLNQKLIGELVLINRIDAPASVLQKVCHTQHSPSVQLLEEMLLEPQGWWKLPEGKGAEDSIAKELVKDLNQTMPEILLSYLGQLQAEAPDAKCLNKHVVGLKNLNLEVKWLQEEIDITKITNHKQRLRKIFEGIKKAPALFQRCRKETAEAQAAAQAKEKSKNKEKGTAKPSSR